MVIGLDCKQEEQNEKEGNHDMKYKPDNLLENKFNMIHNDCK
jgi:hypothetical protein